VPSGRLLEYTDSASKQAFGTNFAKLQELPVLSMPEIGDETSEQVARVGRVHDIKAVGRGHRFNFVANPSSGQFAVPTIERLASKLGIDNWEFRRTHWAVKDIDLAGSGRGCNTGLFLSC